MPPFVVATWNMSHAVKRGQQAREGAWQHLASLHPDVALVQEAGGPSGALTEVGSERDSWSTRVVSYGPSLGALAEPIRVPWNRALEFRLGDNARIGTVAAAQIDVGDGVPLVAISVYGQLRYADQSVLRVIGDLIPLFDSTLRHRVILGGDLNIHTHSNDPAERRRAKPILDLVEALGLRNLSREAMRRLVLKQGEIANAEPCPCDGSDCYHVKTHRHRSHAVGAMASNDYLFGTKWVADRLDKLEVLNGDTDPSWTHSDHAPMIATLSV